MSFNTDVRLKQLESLEQYISSSRDKIQSIFDCLKWNIKDVVKDNHQLIKCSIDPSHRVPLKSVDEHVAKCSLKRDGYDLDEEFLSEPVQNSGSSNITIDDHKKIEILSAAHRNIPNFRSAWNGQDPDPKTADRLACTFSTDERAILYSYAVQNTISPAILPEFNTLQPATSSTDNKPLTYDELRICERNSRRRRIKYKSVHTNRKSHTEVIKEVIDGQMEMYVDWLVDSGLVEQPKNEQERNIEGHQENQQKSRQSSVVDDSDHCNSIISKNSAYSDSSKSTSTRNHTVSHDYKRDKERSYKRNRSRDDSRDRKRHRSRDRYEYRKSRHSHSRDDHYDRKYRKGFKER